MRQSTHPSPSRSRSVKLRSRGRRARCARIPRAPTRRLRSRPATLVPTKRCATDLLHPHGIGVPVPPPWIGYRGNRLRAAPFDAPGRAPGARRRCRGGRRIRKFRSSARARRLPSAARSWLARVACLPSLHSVLVGRPPGTARAPRGRGSAPPRDLAARRSGAREGESQDSHPTAVITRGGTFGPVCPCDDARIGATTSAAGLPFRAERGVGPLGFAARPFDRCALVVSSFEAQHSITRSRNCQIGRSKNSGNSRSKST